MAGLLEMTTEGVLIFELVQNDEIEVRDGYLQKKFQKEEINWVRSCEKMYSVYRVVRTYLWGQVEVNGI